MKFYGITINNAIYVQINLYRSRVYYIVMSSLTTVIKKGEKQFVAFCPELDVVSQGFTAAEALENLKEAAKLYIEEMGI